MPLKKRVLIASDHAGYHLKTEIIQRLPDWSWEDLGPNPGPEGKPDSVDYPDYAEILGKKIASGQAEFGILICGSGIGMSIAANKMPGIRAALVENPVSARLSREHNDANVLCLGSRLVAPEYGAEIAQVWLGTSFSGGSRHLQRIQKIRKLERPSS